MNVDTFDYELPEELIAQTPVGDRTSSRLMVMDRQTGKLKNKRFKDVIDFLQPGDCLALNDTRVLPARLYGTKEDTGAGIEILLLKEVDGDTWETLVKPAKRIKEGTIVTFGDGRLKATCTKVKDEGARDFRFDYEGIFYEVLDALGEMPLPPYIHEKLEDQERYQTVFARHRGSAAAPTAGLHFTEELLEKIQSKGIHVTFLTLHVGLGTFRPVSVDTVEEHKMHSEYYQLTKGTAELLNDVKEKGGRVVAVGTTAVRTLETIAVQNDGKFLESSGWTDIFIYPGYAFRGIDAMMTNFHLPKSTLLMLVSAFAGKDQILAAYNEAVREKYRFFSFGDAMLIMEGVGQNGGRSL